MKVTPTAIAEVLLIEPQAFEDSRGFFFESFNDALFEQMTGLDVTFVQDNHSHSSQSVLRGLHYQLHRPQGKLVRVVYGAVFDVAVDLRRGSPTFGRWVGDELSASNRRPKWIPPGFAHGFLVTSDSADVLYKATEYYAPEFERCLQWDDPAIGVIWPLAGQPTLSAKDTVGVPLFDAATY